MTNEEPVGLFEPEHGAEISVRKSRPDQFILVELINVLTPHAQGLRRWSVMRAMRKHRENAARDIPQKFEDDVERTFRRFCANAEDARSAICEAKDALFYRPKEKAGEVWCVYSDRARAWLDAEHSEFI